jgi:integrase
MSGLPSALTQAPDRRLELAGVNAKALSSYMGHSTITVTLDRYGRLMPGNEDSAAAMLADYLERDAGPGASGLALKHR